MKKVILSLFVVASFAFVSCKGESNTKTETEVQTTTADGKDLSMATFGVRGNCGMCKTTIEKAAKSVDGVASAIWDVKKKSINVSYDEHKINEKEIHKAIAAAGYDTDQAKGDKAAYKSLPKCCQYEGDQVMNQ
ncbi:heavy-metal-associated domain-containing protein [Kordia algicida OT-1]|uniref:Cation-transporting ATPase n=1 Tax=Kordia algicida OT-1 TaxID=391587 RepID=A9EAJ1_9FLAO|nr:heavy-metal-associated domain-containing protein [Kordia algicida]EDP94636.1 cation-transporting ATPase [Kordia algicida OT-1]